MMRHDFALMSAVFRLSAENNETENTESGG
jgi:hypothetical protein